MKIQIHPDRLRRQLLQLIERDIGFLEQSKRWKGRWFVLLAPQKETSFGIHHFVGLKQDSQQRAFIRKGKTAVNRLKRRYHKFGRAIGCVEVNVHLLQERCVSAVILKRRPWCVIKIIEQSNALAETEDIHGAGA